MHTEFFNRCKFSVGTPDLLAMLKSSNVAEEHTQMLRVVNISPSSLRVSIIGCVLRLSQGFHAHSYSNAALIACPGPSTPWFRINVDKKGLLALGPFNHFAVQHLASACNRTWCSYTPGYVPAGMDWSCTGYSVYEDVLHSGFATKR